MVQFNLLPDIKIQYLKARRQKHMVLLISIITIIACVVVLAGLVSTVFVVQKKSIGDLSRDIGTASDELKDTKDLTKMLTVQNQLSALPQLHDEKPVVTRLFTYITQSTPIAASISRMTADFGLQTLTLSGAADTLETVNTFADTLKFTTYHTETNDETEVLAFSSVVLTSFARDAKGATYTITLQFDPVIFSEADQTTLTVPKKVTTRSETEQPEALFQQPGAGQ